jgi:hypothetical protein
VSELPVISDEECAELLSCTVGQGYKRKRVGRGRRSLYGPLPEDPITVPGWEGSLPRLIKAPQAASIALLDQKEFLRLHGLGLTPKPINRNGAGYDRWRLEDILKWTPYKVSFQDGLSRRRGGRYKPGHERTRAPTQIAFITEPPKPVPLSPEAFHLYRHFDADGNLLYVGISLSFLTRLCDHSQRAAWFWKIARVEVTGYATEADALVAERIAIHQEQPLHNIRHARRKA